MANLNDKLIREAYKGLIKTNDEAGITAIPKTLQDGEGNNLPVAVGTTSMVYSGVQNFSGATVLGISGGVGSVSVSYIPETPLQVESVGADTIVYSLVVPANTFSVGDVVMLKALGGTPVGYGYLSIWVHTSPALYSGFPIAVGFGTFPSISFEKTLYIGSATSTRWFDENFPNEGFAGGYGQYSLVDAEVDWTVDQYVMLQGYSDPGDAAFWYGISMTKIN